MTKVAVHDELMGEDGRVNSYRFCCPIFITSMFGTILSKNGDLFGENGAEPKIRSATLTFVSYKNQIYGITCRHVVEALEERNSKKHKEHISSHGKNVPFVEEAQMHFFFPKENDQIHINAKFHKPPGDVFTNSFPDIAIGRISDRKLAQIGREVIDLDKVIPDREHWSEHAGAIATGYPEQNRRSVPADRNLAKMAISTVIAISPFERVSEYKLTMFYELDEEPIADNLSGMSGGPILWSDEASWGLIGIVKKGRDIKSGSSRNKDSFIDGHAIWIDGEPLSKALFEKWISVIPSSEPPIKDISKSLHVPDVRAGV